MRPNIYQINKKVVNKIFKKIWSEYSNGQTNFTIFYSEKENNTEIIRKSDDSVEALEKFHKFEKKFTDEVTDVVVNYMLLQKKMYNGEFITKIKETMDDDSGILQELSEDHDSIRGLVFIQLPKTDYIYILGVGQYNHYLTEAIRETNPLFGIHLLNILINKIGLNLPWKTNKTSVKDVSITKKATEDTTYNGIEFTNSIRRLDLFELLKTTITKVEIDYQMSSLNLSAGSPVLDFVKEHNPPNNFRSFEIIMTCSSYFQMTVEKEEIGEMIEYVKKIDSVWQIFEKLNKIDKDQATKLINEPIYLFFREDKKISKAMLKKYLKNNSTDELTIMPENLETYSNLDYVEIRGNRISASQFPLTITEIKSLIPSVALSTEIKFIDLDGTIIEKGELLHFTHGEIEYNGDQKFLMEGRAYTFDKNYLEIIHKEISKIIEKEHTENPDLYQILDKDSFQNEDSYLKNFKNQEANKIYSGHPNTFKINKFEFFDLCIELNGIFYFIYCKDLKSKGAGIRDLVSQAQITFDTISADFKTASDKFNTKFNTNIQFNKDNSVPVVLLGSSTFDDTKLDRGYLNTVKSGLINQQRSAYLDLMLYSLTKSSEKIIIIPKKKI